MDNSIENCREKIKKYLELIALKYNSLIANKPFNSNLSEIATVETGKRPIIKEPNQNSEYNIPIIGASSIMGYTNVILFNEPILVIGRVGTHGIVQPIFDNCWASDNTLIIKTKYYSFLYNVLKNIDYASINKGSTQPLITQTDIKNTQIYIPDATTLDKFEKDYSLLPIRELNDKIDKLNQLKELYLKKFFDWPHNSEKLKYASVKILLAPKIIF